MKTKAILALLTIGTLLSCDHTKNETAKIKSFELSPINGKDTINITDSNGRKQGIWLKTNRTDKPVSISDTLFYVNDTLVKK